MSAKDKVFTVTDGHMQKIEKRMEEIKRRLKLIGGSPLDPRRVSAALQDIVEGKFYRDGQPLPERQKVDPENIIIVPDLSAADFVQLAKKKLRLTYLNPDLAKWDFIKDERGKTFEVETWSPGGFVRNDEVRKHFSKGFTGNTAAFIAWIIKYKKYLSYHYYASIPTDDRLWCGRDQRGGRCVPYFNLDATERDFSLTDVRDDWHGYCEFSAFREINS